MKFARTILFLLMFVFVSACNSITPTPTSFPTNTLLPIMEATSTSTSPAPTEIVTMVVLTPKVINFEVNTDPLKWYEVQVEDKDDAAYIAYVKNLILQHPYQFDPTKLSLVPMLAKNDNPGDPNMQNLIFSTGPGKGTSFLSPGSSPVGQQYWWLHKEITKFTSLDGYPMSGTFWFIANTNEFYGADPADAFVTETPVFFDQGDGGATNVQIMRPDIAAIHSLSCQNMSSADLNGLTSSTRSCLSAWGKYIASRKFSSVALNYTGGPRKDIAYADGARALVKDPVMTDAQIAQYFNLAYNEHDPDKIKAQLAAVAKYLASRKQPLTYYPELFAN